MLRRFQSIVLCGILLGPTIGCAFLQKNANTVNDVLRASDIACVLLSALTNTDAVMRACRIQPLLRDAVAELVAGKASAQRVSAGRVDAGLPETWGY